MYNWTGRDLPGDWGKLREQRRHLAGGRCEAMSQIDPDGSQHMFGTRCVRVGTECDHHEGRDDHSIENLRWLCSPHHHAKTQAESAAARTRRPPPRRPPEPHPSRW